MSRMLAERTLNTSITILFDDEIASIIHYTDPTSTSVTEGYNTIFGIHTIVSSLKDDFVALPYLTNPSPYAYTMAETYNWDELMAGLTFGDQYSGTLDEERSWDYTFILYKYGYPIDNLHQFDADSLLEWLFELKNSSTSLSLIEGSQIYLPNNNYNVIGGFQYHGEAYITEIKYNTVDLSPVPEPTTILLFGLGVLGFAGVRRKKQ